MKYLKDISFWLLCAIGVATIVFTACEDNNEPRKEQIDPVLIAVTEVFLDTTLLELEIGEEYTYRAIISPDSATIKTLTWSSSNESVATITNGKVTAVAAGNTVISVKAGEKTATCMLTVFNPQTYDKGVVINGIRWATRNVGFPGVFIDNPEDMGMFYQHCSNIGWSNTNTMIASNGSVIWDSSFPTDTIWSIINSPCPKGWRLPTKDEMQNLFNSGSEWTTINGIKGRYYGNGDNRIFLPAAMASYRKNLDGSLKNLGVVKGFYWTSNIYENDKNVAFCFAFCSQTTGVDYLYRNYAISIRCVAE